MRMEPWLHPGGQKRPKISGSSALSNTTSHEQSATNQRHLVCLAGAGELFWSHTCLVQPVMHENSIFVKSFSACSGEAQFQGGLSETLGQGGVGLAMDPQHCIQTVVGGLQERILESNVAFTHATDAIKYKGLDFSFPLAWIEEGINAIRDIISVIRT